jgi:hypothetical protein
MDEEMTTFTCSFSKHGNNLIKSTMVSKERISILTEMLLTVCTAAVGLSTRNPRNPLLEARTSVKHTLGPQTLGPHLWHGEYRYTRAPIWGVTLTFVLMDQPFKRRGFFYNKLTELEELTSGFINAHG